MYVLGILKRTGFQREKKLSLTTLQVPHLYIIWGLCYNVYKEVLVGSNYTYSGASARIPKTLGISLCPPPPTIIMIYTTYFF